MARGKQLGLSLDEITELLVLLDQEECGPVQTRIRQLVTEWVAQAQEQIAELVAFTAQLQTAGARIGVHTPDGGCDDECGCRSDPGRSTAGGGDLIPLAGVGSVDIACSLHPDLVGGRIDEWNQMLASGTSRETIPNGIRVRFDRNVDAHTLAGLAAAEQTCCSFFHFDIGIGAEGVTLDVTGPDDAASHHRGIRSCGMTRRLRALLVGAACLACCLPLILGLIGATTGVARGNRIRPHSRHSALRSLRLTGLGHWLTG